MTTSTLLVIGSICAIALIIYFLKPKVVKTGKDIDGGGFSDATPQEKTENVVENPVVEKPVVEKVEINLEKIQSPDKNKPFAKISVPNFNEADEFKKTSEEVEVKPKKKKYRPKKKKLTLPEDTKNQGL